MFNVVDHFSGWFVGNSVDYLLDNLLYFDNDWLLNHPLHYLFNYLLNFLDSLLYFLDHNSLLFNHLNLFDLGNWMIDDFLNYHRLFLFDDLLFDDLDLNNLGDLHSSFHDLLNYLRNLNHLFFDDLDLNYFFDYSVNIL